MTALPVGLSALVDELLIHQPDPHTLTPAPYPLEVVAERGTQDDALEGLGGGTNGDDLRVRRATAIASGLRMARAGTFVGIGYCLRETRGLLAVPPLWPDATTGWEQADDKHHGEPHPDSAWGVPLWWVNDGPGHVALDLRRDGLCLTTDYVETGRWGVAPIDKLAAWCGGRFRGWTGDINGVTVWRPPQPFGHDDRVQLVRNALDRARAAGGPQRRIDGLRKWLDQLKGT